MCFAIPFFYLQNHVTSDILYNMMYIIIELKNNKHESNLRHLSHLSREVMTVCVVILPRAIRRFFLFLWEYVVKFFF